MENNLSSMLDVFLDLVQALSKLVKNTNEKIVLESLNYIIKCINYLYSQLNMSPFSEEQRRVSVLNIIRLHSIEEVRSEECSPFSKDFMLASNKFNVISSLEEEKSRLSSFYSEKNILPIKLQTTQEEDKKNFFENINFKCTPSTHFSNRDIKKILESILNIY